MAHSWVQMFDSEYEAFAATASCIRRTPSCSSTPTTRSRAVCRTPSARFNEVLRPLGIRKCGIRLDSGDMTYLTKKARKMLDEASWPECEISVSNSLDEYLIQDLLRQGAQIDMFGIGERLITAKSEPVFGGVYKLVAVERPDGTIEPKIKISENVGKITNPHFKSSTASTARTRARPLRTISLPARRDRERRRGSEIFDPEAT